MSLSNNATSRKVLIAFLVLDSAMPPGQTKTSEVRVDFRRFEHTVNRTGTRHTNGQYGGADKTAAADAVKEDQMKNMGQRRRGGKKEGISSLTGSR
jgi:hypothetical protein